MLQHSEAQPGLKNMLSITYDTQKNRIFSDYMASRWPELAPMNFADIWHLLTGLEKQLLPLDSACFQRYCSPDRLATRMGKQLEYQLYLCDLFCHESLFQLKTSVEISPERFFHFTKSLNSLVTTDGQIFFGTCNPGSAAPEKVVELDETELLINSTLLAGRTRATYIWLAQ